MDIKLLYQIIKNPISELGDIGYGADALKDTMPHVYQAYLAIDTKKIYYCLTDGVWIEYSPLNIVNGSVLYTLPASDGIAGQILKTDGNGNLYWGDPGEGMLPSATVEQYNVINSIAGNSQVTIVTYNNTGSILWLTGCIGTGDLPGEYVLYVDGNEKGVVRTSEQHRNGKIIIPKDIKVAIGSIITVKVTHWHQPKLGEFKATIYGYRL